MQHKCSLCSSDFAIDQCDLDFYTRISPAFADQAIPIPPPTLCPDCRLLRRAVWRNEFQYYPRTCPHCHNQSISVHSEDKPYPVYCNRCWWHDRTDLREFGLQLDLNRSFFEQFAELQSRCPKPFMANDNHTASENIEYCQGTAYSKNCYLVSTSWRLEDSLYCSNCGESRNLVDCRFAGDGCELLYESATCTRCYSASFLYGCSGCSDCHFGVDLRGCSNCIGCVGLRNQQYQILNVQYSPDDYRRELGKFSLETYSGQQEFKTRFELFAATQPQRGVFQINCECSSGNNLFQCKNFSGFNVFEGEDCRHYYLGTRPKNCYDILVGGEHEWCYEGVNPDHSYMSHFTVWCWNCRNVLYSDNCHASHDLFGCVGLRRAEYCILNTQYSKEAYERIVPQLAAAMRERGEWGEFFPFSVTPFAYNETVAQEYAPLSAENAGQLGASWLEPDAREYRLQNYAIPDSIADVPDLITKEVLACACCNRNYKIAALELQFYRTMHLPIPRECSDCRRKARFSRSGVFKTWQVDCSGCGERTESATPPGARSSVLCPKCYS